MNISDIRTGKKFHSYGDELTAVGDPKQEYDGDGYYWSVEAKYEDGSRDTFFEEEIDFEPGDDISFCGTVISYDQIHALKDAIKSKARNGAELAKDLRKEADIRYSMKE